MDFALLKKIRRPLKEFNLKSIALLVALWVLLLLGSDGCSTTPSYLATAYATMTVCIALWTNHLALPPINRARDVFKLIGISLYDLFSISLFVVLASIPFSLLTVECYGPRAKVSELILAASNYRSQINERFDAQRTLTNVGQGIRVELSRRVRAGVVTADGTIVLASDDPPAVVFLSPHADAGKLTWKCNGVLKKVMPKACTEEPNQ